MPASPHLRLPVMSRRSLGMALGVGLGLAAWPVASQAALKTGAAAPAFTVEAALGGKPFTFDLTQALREGPVVLYFFPKAFTTGCTLEAHAFAEAQPKFAALGARILGVSNDDLATIQRFSTEACRSAFPVAADRDSKVIRAYDAGLAFKPDTADRISYVIGRDGRIALVYGSMNPTGHVDRTLEAVQKLAAPAGSASR